MACAFSQYRQLEAVRRATNSAPVDRALRCSSQCRLFRRTPVFCDVRFRCAIGLREFSYSEPQKEKRQRHSPPGGKPPGSLAGELIDQGLLCSGSMAKNVRTSRAISAAIWSAHLRRRYRIPEIFLRCCRGSPRSFSISRLTYSANEIPSAAALAWARRCNSGSTLMCLRVFIWSSIANVDSMPRAAQAVIPYRSSCASCRRPPRNWRR